MQSPIRKFLTGFILPIIRLLSPKTMLNIYSMLKSRWCRAFKIVELTQFRC